jgi:hypothetical protein
MFIQLVFGDFRGRKGLSAMWRDDH